jgi:HlyD family secretion protein
VTVRKPLMEMLKSGSRSHGDALVRRQRRVSLNIVQSHCARRPPGTRLAWAVFGILAGVVVALAGAVVALVCLLLNRHTAEPVPQPAAIAPTAVATEKQPEESAVAAGESVLNCKGFVLPVQRVVVSPKVGGMIVKLHISEGCRVKKGDVLAELEDVDYKADFLRAQSAVETARRQIKEAETSQPKEFGQAEAELERSKVELAQSKSDFERSRELFFKHKALSKVEYELSETRFREAQHHVRSMDCALGRMQISLGQKIAAARTQLEDTEADLVKARWRLENCMVRAPSGGTILKKNAEEGNLINPVAFNDSFSLCELADLSELEVELAIHDHDFCKVKRGQRCKVRTEAFPERIYDAVVSRLMPVGDRRLSTLPIRVKIKVPQGDEGTYLKPEMIAVVSFLGDSAIARLGDAEKASNSTPRKQGLPATSSMPHRAVPASG